MGDAALGPQFMNGPLGAERKKEARYPKPNNSEKYSYRQTQSLAEHYYAEPARFQRKGVHEEGENGTSEDVGRYTC